MHALSRQLKVLVSATTPSCRSWLHLQQTGQRHKQQTGQSGLDTHSKRVRCQRQLTAAQVPQTAMTPCPSRPPTHQPPPRSRPPTKHPPPAPTSQLT